MLCNLNELPEMEYNKEAMLTEVSSVEDNSRLGCQLNITPELKGLEFTLASEEM